VPVWCLPWLACDWLAFSCLPRAPALSDWVVIGWCLPCMRPQASSHFSTWLHARTCVCQPTLEATQGQIDGFLSQL
jgi:hypothetical protein